MLATGMVLLICYQQQNDFKKTTPLQDVHCIATIILTILLKAYRVWNTQIATCNPTIISACTYKNTKTYILMVAIFIEIIKSLHTEYNILHYYRHTSLIMPLAMKLLVKQAYIYGNWFKTYICNYFCYMSRVHNAIYRNAIHWEWFIL